MMRLFRKNPPLEPKDTSIPRTITDLKLERDIERLQNTHKDFTKTLEKFISDVQKANRGIK